jgi:hypothetical protein
VAAHFVEALVLASFAAALGLVAADQLLKWGVASVSARNGGPPFWMTPGLDVRTIVYAEGLAIVCAASISLLPALRATRTRIQFQLANLGTGGSTLRFGSVWTTAMIAQVALTVIAIPIAGESLGQMIRKDAMRAEFPSREYVSARIDLDRSFADEATSAFGERRARTFAELERRVRQEPGVVAVTMANDVPGGAAAVRVADVEPLPGDPSDYDDLFWTATVGPNFFDTLDRAIVTGRDFDGRDLAATARTVIVNEAFARRFDRQTHRGSPVGARLKYQARSIASSPAAEVEPWFEIVGVVRDVGLNPEDRGACCEEAPFIYHAASTGTIAPYVMTIRVRGNPAALTARLPALAAAISPGLRVEEAHALPQWIERRYQANRVMQSAQAGVTLLALFLSALGIYSLMSVSVTRRAREIGLRSALGAGPADVLAGVIRRATVLMGGGVAVGAGVLLTLAFAGGEEFTSMIGRWTAITSAVMLLAGICASLGPARRALRINPTEALRES